MTPTRLRAVVIGAGVESLVAATLLARAGLHTCVVEKRDEAGGRFSPWPATTGAPVSRVFDYVPTLHPGVVGWLRREQPRLELDTVGVSVCCRDRNGRDLVLTGQPELDHQAISNMSTSDAERYPAFLATLGRLAGVLAPLLQRAPPGASSAQDAWAALVTGRRYLGLSRREMFELLRWPPMPVADLVEEWFASEPLRALVAMRGLNGVFAGPRSAGTSAVLLMQAAASANVGSAASAVTCGAPALLGALMASLAAHAGTLRANA